MKLTSPPPATFTLMTNSAQSPESSPVSFAKLLAPLLADLAPDVLPAFLARLERTAAARYRQWSRDVPAWTSDLLACADAEDEIANRILAAFPISAEWATALDERVPAAREIYFSAFDGLAVLDQLRLQAAAERQGAQAWGVHRVPREWAQRRCPCRAREMFRAGRTFRGLGRCIARSTEPNIQ